MSSERVERMLNLDESYWDEFNCGGLALNLREWVTPYWWNAPAIAEDKGNWTCANRIYFITDLIERGVPSTDIINAVWTRDVEYLLAAYPTLYRVESPDLIPENKRAIAYRVGADTNGLKSVEDIDFHFRVRLDGEWIEKIGNGPIEVCPTLVEDEWYSEDWYSRVLYSSPTAYFGFDFYEK